MWRIRSDMLGHYINGQSTITFKDMVERLNQLEVRDEILEPKPIMGECWDCDSNEPTGEKFQEQNERYDYIYTCKACGSEIFLDNYCSKCGQKLR